QRKYTSIPLTYGALNASLIGTEKEYLAFETRVINAFAKIPLIRKDGSIFPNRDEIRSAGLHSTITTSENSRNAKHEDPEHSIANTSQATATLS
ncbi:hypothetical protein ABTM79_18995, partial [Acinetobacter baumannii]